METEAPPVEEKSIEERIEDKIFGAEPEEEELEAQEVDDVEEVEEPDEEEVEAADEEVEEAEFVEMEIDGDLYQVPVALKDHLMRNKDYTEKTQALSAQRKQAEIQLEAIAQERRQYEFTNSIYDDLQQVQLADHQITQYRQYLKENLDNLSGQEIEKIRFQVEELQANKNTLTSSLQNKWTEFQQAQEQSMQELLTKSTETLRAKIPGWSEATQREVRDFALQAGFTDAEVNQVYDPRYVEILYKAAQYDKLKSNTKGAVKRVADSPTIKPKSRNPMPDDVKRKLNLRKKLKSNLSAKDKADVIRDDIASRLF